MHYFMQMITMKSNDLKYNKTLKFVPESYRLQIVKLKQIIMIS